MPECVTTNTATVASAPRHPEWEREPLPTLLETCHKDGGGQIFSFNFELYDPGHRETDGVHRGKEGA